jgi:mRNA interferase MazF
MVRRPGIVPDAGDMVWLEFDPEARHEQAADRIAVVAGTNQLAFW